jgi:hypothetical protein
VRRKGVKYEGGGRGGKLEKWEEKKRKGERGRGKYGRHWKYRLWKWAIL